MEKFSVVRSAGLMDLSVKQSGETFWDFPRALQGEGGEGAQARGEGGSEGPLTNSGRKEPVCLADDQFE